MRPGEFRGRALLVAACVAALVGLVAMGCSRNGGISPTCESACRAEGMRAMEVRAFDMGVCRCERGGTAADGGASR